MPVPDVTHRRELMRGSADAWVMTADLLAAPLAWGGIGWLLDRWLGTSPWVMVAGLCLGFVLGFYLLYRRATAAMMREEARRAAVTAAPGRGDA